MPKNFLKSLLLILSISLLFNCERDDICIDATTPNLIIRFYNQTDNETIKTVDNLKVEIDSLGTFINYNSYTSIDSLTIPLRIDDDITTYRFTIDESTSPIVDEFDLNYTRDFVFVSRSCGYKTEFLNISTSNQSNNWINAINILKQDIQDENEAHISIYH